MKMDNILVSIIMPAYNAGQFIAASIESVIKQTYTHWELIIVDDDSTDNTKEIALSYADKDSRIRYMHQQSGKQGKAKNNGIKQANANLIAFLDADDIWVKEKLFVQLDILQEHPDIDLIFSDVAVIDKNGNVIKDSLSVGEMYYKAYPALEIFFKNNRIPALTVLARKKSILDAGGFDEFNETQYGEDYGLWIRMLLRGAIFLSTAHKLGLYRMHDEQSTGNKPAMIQVITMLQHTQVTEKKLTNAKNAALKQWIKKFLRLNKVVAKRDLGNAVAAYPNSGVRNFLQICHTAGLNFLTRKLLYLFCSM